MRILCQFHGWLIFARVIALYMFVWPYVHLHILCTQLVICLLLDFSHIWYLGWPWSEHAHIIPISRMVDFCESYSPFHVCLTICPFAHLVYATSHLSFVAFYSYFGILIGRDLSMCILYRFHGWLIFARVIALFMFVWPYVRPHILCMQLVICLLSHFIHIWYLDWLWSEHVHIIPISRRVDFCESYSPFQVCLTICPFAHLVYATSLLSHFIHIWYLDWPWSEHAHILPISRMIDFYESYSPFHICLTIRPSAHLVYATSHLSFVAFYSYLVSWLAVSMRILYRFHGWLIFARVIALFMFVWPYVRSHILCTQLVICLFSHFIHIWYLDLPWSEHAHIILISQMVDFCENYSPFHVCLTIHPFAHLVYATSHLSFVAFYSYLVSWLAMIWACAYYTDFTDGWFLREL
jgi:hypothetical protein